jgi:hypothetical protein
MNNKQAAEKNKKRHVPKRAGCPKLHRVGEENSLTQTVNKPAREGRSGGLSPAILEWRKLVTVAVVWKVPLERRGGALPHMNCK